MSARLRVRLWRIAEFERAELPKAVKTVQQRSLLVMACETTAGILHLLCEGPPTPATLLTGYAIPTGESGATLHLYFHRRAA